MGLFRSSWERQVDNNLFDYIDVDLFKNKRAGTIWNYLVMIFLLILSIIFYCVDIYTCIKLLAFNEWSSQVKPYLSFKISKWLFAACIICSLVLLIYESVRGIRVFRTRNISLIYTNHFAKTAKSLQSYKYFCVLNEINPTKGFDKMAFYTYFTFHQSKKLILADSPRQVINALTLYSVFNVQYGFWETIKKISVDSQNEAVILYTMTVSFAIWLFFIFQFFFALVFAVPVFHRVLHTLKFKALRQYVCVKVDRTVKILAKHHQKKTLYKLTLENQKKYKPTLPDIDPLKFTPTLPQKPSTFTSINSINSNRTVSDSTIRSKPTTINPAPENPFSDSHNQSYEMSTFKSAVAKPIEQDSTYRSYTPPPQNIRKPPQMSGIYGSRNDSSHSLVSKPETSLRNFSGNSSISLASKPEPAVPYSGSTYSLLKRPDFGSNNNVYQGIPDTQPRQERLNSESSEDSVIEYPKRTVSTNIYGNDHDNLIDRDPESLLPNSDFDLSDEFDDEFDDDFDDSLEKMDSSTNLTGGRKKKIRQSLLRRAQEMDSEDYTRFNPSNSNPNSSNNTINGSRKTSETEVPVFRNFQGRKVLR